MDIIQTVQDSLKSKGYYASPYLAKIITLFLQSGNKNKRSIPALLLQGESGAGKTFLAETFAKMISAEKKFVQCFPRMGTENFQFDIDIQAVIKQDPDKSIKEGILLQAIQQSHKGPVVLIIDELDKARAEVDSFLLDFLENGRLTTGTDTYEKGEYPIYTFITSNDKRTIDDALRNRCKIVNVPRPNKELFLEILNLPENHYLGYIYDKCPSFSIRQAKQYMEDLNTLGEEFDQDALSQYINLNELDVKSLADLQRISGIDDAGLEFELPDLPRYRKEIDSDSADAVVNLINNNNCGIRLCSDDDGNLFINIDTVEQLQIASQYLNLKDRYNGYDGWFECSSSSEELQSANIIWANNENKNSTVRFGLKTINGKTYEVVLANGKTFVHLNSSRYKLEDFLELPQKDISEDSEDVEIE